MAYNVVLSEHFQKEAKRLLKKYASLKTELSELFAELETNPTKGIHLGDGVYKIRLAIASKNKGKSGGARVMTFIKVDGSIVLLFSIYNKGEKDAISKEEIDQLLNEYL